MFGIIIFTVCCIDNAMFSSAEKQGSIGSFVNKLYKGFYNIPQKPGITDRESVT